MSAASLLRNGGVLAAVLLMAAHATAAPAAEPAPEARQENAAPGERETAPAPRTGRFFLAAGAGLQPVSTPVLADVAFDHPLFGSETGGFDADLSGGDGDLIEISAGFWLRPRFGIAVAATRVSFGGDALVAARIPHPFLFDRPLSVEGSESGLSRDETAVHLQLMWRIRTGRKFELSLFAGPTFFELEQDLVSGVEFDWSYPFDEAALRGAHRQRQSASSTGWNAGAEAVYWFGGRAGLGANVRHSRDSVGLATADGESVAVDVGGLQTSLGLRVRF